MSHSQRKWTAELLAEILDGTWVVEPPEGWFCEAIIWNKADGVVPNSMFVVKTERTAKSVKNYCKSISGVIVERKMEIFPETVPQLLIKDTKVVLDKICKYTRKSMTGKVIGITGLVGKSSTKEMMAQAFSKHGSVVASLKSYNFAMGVFQTLARGVSDPDFMILEMASIVFSTETNVMKVKEYCRPDIVVVTEIGVGHVNKNKVTARDVAHQKSKIAAGIKKGGIAVLNRDMEEFEYVKSQMEGYGATVVTYGFHPEADMCCVNHVMQDNKMRVSVSYKGETYQYVLSLLGKGAISSSMATLLTAESAGVHISDILESFAVMKPNDNVCIPMDVELKNGGKVHILNDTHNAQVRSVLGAIETFKEYAAQYPKGRKIYILGRINDLEEETEKWHRYLAKPLLEQNPDLVFLHGEEMRYLAEELPKEVLAGYYADINLCAKAVAGILKEDDCVLMKGSVSSSDFYTIRRKLPQMIAANASMDARKALFSDEIFCDYGVQVVDMASGETLWTEGNPYAKRNRGLGSILVLISLLQAVNREEYQFTDRVIIGKSPLQMNRTKNALRLEMGEEVSLYTLLSGIACCHAPDAILAVADMLGGYTEGKSKIQNLAKELGISKNAVHNFTGRALLNRPQSFSLNDLSAAGKELFTMEVLPVLRTEVIEYKGRILQTKSNLYTKEVILGAYLFGANEGEGVILVEHLGRRYMIAVCNADDAAHRDELVLQAIQKIKS